MIAKRILRNKGTSSFERLGNYILNVKGVKTAPSMVRTFDYILREEGIDGRVGTVRFENCIADNLPLACKEIIATQAMNTLAKSDRTYHLVVSFAPGEKPTEAQLIDIENELCIAIGLGQHQRISATHVDTAHLHLHIAINKIHPQSFRCIEPYYDKQRLMAACERLELKHGLARTNHGLDKQSEFKGRAKDWEARTGELSFLSWVKETAGPALEAQLPKVEGWQSLHRLLGEYNLDIKPRGAGFVIKDRTSARAVKASNVSPALAFKALTDRWGAFEPYQGEDMPVKHRYRKAPLHRTDTAKLYADYERARQTAIAARDQAFADHHATIAEWRERFEGSFAKLRELIRNSHYTSDGKRYERAKLERQRERELWDADKRHAEEVEAIKAQYPVLSWQHYLEAQAANGNITALTALRQSTAKRERESTILLAASNARSAKDIVFRNLQPTARRNGDLVYRLKDGGVVIDHKVGIDIEKLSPHAIFLMLSLAMERTKNKVVPVTGSDELKKQAVEIAANLKLDLRFANADMESQRERLMIAQKITPQPNSALEAYVTERNVKAKSISSVLPHRAWTAGDAGAVRYQGRRQLEDGSLALLFKKDDEILVKSASLAEAEKASFWKIGKAVAIDADGRYVKHGRSQ